MAHKLSIWIGIGVALAFITLSLLYNLRPVTASSFPGGFATQGVATTTLVGPLNVTTLYTARTSCASRVIGTNGAAIQVIFDDPSDGNLASTTFSGVKGFWQAASSTTVYDSGLYGCGRLQAIASASTTITTAEFR